MFHTVRPPDSSSSGDTIGSADLPDNRVELGKYSLQNPGQLFMVQGRQRAVLSLLAQEGFGPVAEKDILEVGCGDGRVLFDFLAYGADASRLYGVDLLETRVRKARRLIPGAHWTTADAQSLPYGDAQFDLVAQFTMFTSILDDTVRAQAAAEMLRVVRPRGLILWYDFWWNPTNHRTRGIRAGQIRSLFPDCHCTFRRLTLAPPIVRILAKYSWIGCQFLENLRFLCSHYLVAIRPQSATVASGGTFPIRQVNP